MRFRAPPSDGSLSHHSWPGPPRSSGVRRSVGRAHAGARSAPSGEGRRFPQCVAGLRWWRRPAAPKPVPCRGNHLAGRPVRAAARRYGAGRVCRRPIAVGRGGRMSPYWGGGYQSTRTIWRLSRSCVCDLAGKCWRFSVNGRGVNVHVARAEVRRKKREKCVWREVVGKGVRFTLPTQDAIDRAGDLVNEGWPTMS